MTPSPDNSAAHTALRNEILVELSNRFHPKGLFWAVNVVRAQAISRPKSGPPKTRIIRAGLKGQADIAGCVLGRHVEIEVKTGKGEQRESQHLWETAVTTAGGTYILARSVDDAVNGIRDLLGDIT